MYACLIGLICCVVAGVGGYDVLAHHDRPIGDGVIIARLHTSDCGGRTCRSTPSVRVRVDRAGRDTAVLHSYQLYDRFGTAARPLPVQLEVDTFTDEISGARIDGKWIQTTDTSRWWLLLIIPALGFGIAAFWIGRADLWALITLPRVWFAAARRPYHRSTKRKLVGLTGAALFGTALIVIWAAGTFAHGSGSYWLDGGSIDARYAHVSGRDTYHEGVLVHGDDGSTRRVQSTTLYDLMAGRRAPIALSRIEEDGGSKTARITSVTAGGTTYDLDGSSWWLIFLFAPFIVWALSRVVQNALALRSANAPNDRSAGTLA